MPLKIIPPEASDVTLYMRKLFIRTEQAIINEITRKRAKGYVDYAEVAALERVQRILQNMTDESWIYVPEMIEKIFYKSEKDAAGYANARILTAAQTDVIQTLANNLLGEISEAADTAYKTVQNVFTVARLEQDPFRESALKQVLRQEASGIGWSKTSAEMIAELQNKGITAFEDKAGRKWSLTSYGNMAVRTTARQAEVAAILTADDWDLWQIVKIGSTCPVCAPLEGRIYSKSGKNHEYPPLSLAFGKIDPDGPDELSNTYLNIHPSCLHSLVRYTTVGKSDKQIQKDKDFSDPKKNPLDRDPRTKKQIEAYRTKEKNRRQLISDIRQHREYRAALGSEVPKDFDSFRELKYNNPDKWRTLQKTKRIYTEIDKKNWTDEFKLKSKQSFKRFKDNGIMMSSHALSRLTRLNAEGLPVITESDLIDFINNSKPKYKEGTRDIYISKEKVLTVVQNSENKDIISIVRRSKIKNGWSEIIR